MGMKEVYELHDKSMDYPTRSASPAPRLGLTETRAPLSLSGRAPLCLAIL